MTAIGLLALALAADPQVALRPDRPPVTQAQAGAMTPVALADALLAPGHPPIIERVLLPEGVPVPPPPYVPPLDVRLVAAATLDASSGFCVKRSWRVGNERGGEGQVLEAEPTLYRLPSAADGCEAPRGNFFQVAPADRPRAFTVIRLVAAAARHAGQVGFPLSIDDLMGREEARYCAGLAGGCAQPVAILTDPRRALADFPVTSIFAIGRGGMIDADLFTPAELAGRENWKLFAGGGTYTAHVVLDGDRIVAMKLRRRIPPPF